MMLFITHRTYKTLHRRHEDAGNGLNGACQEVLWGYNCNEMENQARSAVPKRPAGDFTKDLASASIFF